MAQSKKINKKKKKDKSFEKNDKSLVLGLIIAIVIFVFVIYKIINALLTNEETYNLSGEVYYQYFYGVMEEYSGDIEVVVNDDNIQMILDNEQTIYLDSTPLYYSDILGKVLFAQEMELIFPDKGNYKLNKFTNIIEENNLMYIKNYKDKDSDKIILDNAFLYDGSDLYFFLEDTTITVGEREYEISPLSYVIVNYRQNVEIYDYETDNYIIIVDEDELTADVLATNSARNYTINMSLDSLITVNNQSLLITNINNLQEYDY